MLVDRRDLPSQSRCRRLGMSSVVHPHLQEDVADEVVDDLRATNDGPTRWLSSLAERALLLRARRLQRLLEVLVLTVDVFCPIVLIHVDIGLLVGVLVVVVVILQLHLLQIVRRLDPVGAGAVDAVACCWHAQAMLRKVRTASPVAVLLCQQSIRKRSHQRWSAQTHGVAGETPHACSHPVSVRCARRRVASADDRRALSFAPRHDAVRRCSS